MTRIGVEVGVGRARLKLFGGNISPRTLSVDAHGARIALVATTALLLGGDAVELDITVGPGAWLEIVETAGTVAYDADGALSTWSVSAAVDTHGLLLWKGEPLVVADGAHVVRRSSISLAEGAGACIRDTIVLGRTGETGGAVLLDNRVDFAHGPLLVERLDLTSSDRRSRPGALGPNRVVDTVSLFGFRAPSESALPAGNLFQLDGPGSIGRYLGSSTASSPADDWWMLWSRAARKRSHGPS